MTKGKCDLCSNETEVFRHTINPNYKVTILEKILFVITFGYCGRWKNKLVDLSCVRICCKCHNYEHNKRK